MYVKDLKFKIIDCIVGMLYLPFYSVWSLTVEKQQVLHNKSLTISKTKHTGDDSALIIHATMEQEVQVNVFLLNLKYLV